MSGEHETLKILVVDDQPYQRRLIAETLRAHSRVRLEQAENASQCFEVLGYFQPDILITDWDMADGCGIELVKRLRAGEAGVTLKKLPVIMVAERNTPADVELARNCGIDEFLLRPFSTQALMARVDAVTRKRRDFVESAVYIGPCRRRRRDSYEGPMRRLFDDGGDDADSPDIQIKKGLARTYVERIGARIAAFDPDDRVAMREIFLAAGQLHAVAVDMRDKLLTAAAESLFNYVNGVGASPRLDADVVSAHLDAMLQLVDLPNSQIEIRTTVTHELNIMVRKKLSAA